jgi:hypothetical protein
MKKLIYILFILTFASCKQKYIDIISNDAHQYFKYKNSKIISNSDIMYFDSGSYVMSVYRGKKDFRDKDELEANVYDKVYLKKNMLPSRDINYEILGILSFLDDRRVVFISQFNKNIGDRFIDVSNNEELKFNKDFKKSFGFYKIDENDSTKIAIQLTKWKDTRSLFLFYTFEKAKEKESENEIECKKKARLVLDSCYLSIPCSKNGVYEFTNNEITYKKGELKNNIMTFCYNSKNNISYKAWYYDYIFYDTTLIKKNTTNGNIDKRIHELELKSIKRVNDTLYSIQLKDTTFHRKELFWNSNQQNSN